MFTGLIEEVGVVEHVRHGAYSAQLIIAASTVLDGTQVGDSIAVDGVCLTVTGLQLHGYTTDVMHETLSRSTLANAREGTRVNLERAMPADGRFGGHIVTGHVDGTARLVERRPDDNAVWFRFAVERQLMRHIVDKGSIAVNGVSLTVAGTTPDGFSISAIPHTLSHTTLANLKPGMPVNLETDIIGKYVEHMIQPDGTATLDESRLRACGF